MSTAVKRIPGTPPYHEVVVCQITYHIIGPRQRQYHVAGEIFPTHREARAWGASHTHPMAEFSRYGHPRRKKGDDGYITQKALREWTEGDRSSWLRGFSIKTVRALTADYVEFTLKTEHTTHQIHSGRQQ